MIDTIELRLIQNSYNKTATFSVRVVANRDSPLPGKASRCLNSRDSSGVSKIAGESAGPVGAWLCLCPGSQEWQMTRARPSHWSVNKKRIMLIMFPAHHFYNNCIYCKYSWESNLFIIRINLQWWETEFSNLLGQNMGLSLRWRPFLSYWCISCSLSLSPACSSSCLCIACSGTRCEWPVSSTPSSPSAVLSG